MISNLLDMLEIFIPALIVALLYVLVMGFFMGICQYLSGDHQ